MVSLCVCWGWGTVRPGGGVRGPGRVSYPLAGMQGWGVAFLRRRLVGRLLTQGNVFQSEGGRGKHRGRRFFNLGNSRGIYIYI